MKIVHEGRGGYIELDAHRYVIELVDAGGFCIHFPSGNRGRARDAHLAVLEALCAQKPEMWRLERRDRRR